jgi:hypothetical protein
MEVHAHSHSHGKKNWKAYFWEFLMLFLAVFCVAGSTYCADDLEIKLKSHQYRWLS